jgi:hypothetical protein
MDGREAQESAERCTTPTPVLAHRYSMEAGDHKMELHLFDCDGYGTGTVLARFIS